MLNSCNHAHHSCKINIRMSCFIFCSHMQIGFCCRIGLIYTYVRVWHSKVASLKLFTGLHQAAILCFFDWKKLNWLYLLMGYFCRMWISDKNKCWMYIREAIQYASPININGICRGTLKGIIFVLFITRVIFRNAKDAYYQLIDFISITSETNICFTSISLCY